MWPACGLAQGGVTTGRDEGGAQARRRAAGRAAQPHAPQRRPVAPHLWRVRRHVSLHPASPRLSLTGNRHHRLVGRGGRAVRPEGGCCERAATARLEWEPGPRAAAAACSSAPHAPLPVPRAPSRRPGLPLSPPPNASLLLRTQGMAEAVNALLGEKGVPKERILTNF